MQRTLTVVLCLLWLYSNSQSLDGSFISKYDRLLSEGQNLELIGNDLELTGWKGEVVIAQLVFWSDQNLNDLAVSIEDFKNDESQIPKDGVQINYPSKVRGDLEGRGCGQFSSRSGSYWIWDKLGTEIPNRINAGDTLAVWVSVQIPEDIASGNYRSNLLVNAGDKQKLFSLTIEVVDLSIPVLADCDFHLDIWQFPTSGLEHYNNANPNSQIELWSDAHFDLFLPAYELLADAGQKVISTQIKSGALGMPSMVQWIKNIDETWSYDYSAFDRYVNALMELGIDRQISCFSPVGWNESTIPFWNESTQQENWIETPINSDEYEVRWDHFLKDFKEHLETKGWFDKTVLYLDEVSEEKLQRVVEVVKGNNENWKLGIAYSHGLSAASKEPFHDLSGILEDANNTGINDDEISTFYTSCTQPYPNSYVSLSNSPAEMSWMGYHSANYGYDGYLRWAYDYWKKSDPDDTRDGPHTAGDYAFIYRNGNDTPMEYYSSIRFELLKEGIEQYEKIKVLLTAEVITDAQKEALNSAVSEFTRMSGSRSRELVETADAVVDCISTGGLTCEELVTSIDSPNSLEQIRLYPNPVGDEITIRNLGSAEYSVSFRDVQGKQILLEELENSGDMRTFSISELSAGMYLAVLYTKEEIKQYKFIVD